MDPGARRARAELASRLRERREEIEGALRTRTYAIADPAEVTDPAYGEGLRAALGAALDYGLAGIETASDRLPPIPALLLAQARLAARNRISLETVLRRYFAGYTLLGDFLMCEIDRGELLSGGELRELQRTQAALFDSLVANVSEEYVRESVARTDSSEEHRADRVRRLLAGELLDPGELGYDLEGWHLGLAATGPQAPVAVRALAQALGSRLLLVHPGEGEIWAWLGGRRRLDPAAAIERAEEAPPFPGTLAFGEPAQGLPGWRMTHRQATAALWVARQAIRPCVRYADVALLASASRDEVLLASLRQLYLEPLSRERDDGEVWRRTLRTYFATQRNVTSTASAMGVTRKTVALRLRAIEQRLGRSLETCAAELQVALQLSELHSGQAAPLLGHLGH